MDLPEVQKVLSDTTLQEQIFEVLQKDSGLLMYSEMIASNAPEAAKKLAVIDRADIVKVWDENIHIIKYFPLSNLTNVDGDELIKTFNELLEIFKKTSLIVSHKTDKVKYWLYAPGRNAKFWKDFYKEGIMGRYSTSLWSTRTR